MDYRLQENRTEAFVRWYAWSLKYDDCDPAVWCTNYLHDRYEHNDEVESWEQRPAGVGLPDDWRIRE